MFARLWHRLRDEVEYTSILLVIAFIFIGISIFWGLGSTPTGMSPAEKTAIASASGFSEIANWPLNAPHKLLQALFTSLGQQNAWFMRLPSALFGFLFSLTVYFILKNWFGRFIGLLGAILFVGTPLFMVLSRNAVPAIMVLAFLLPVVFYIAFKKTTNRILFNLGLIFLTAAALYSPGSPWILVLLAVIWRKSLFSTLSQIPRKWLMGSMVMFGVIVLPLIISSASPSFLREWLLLPQHFSTVVEMVKNLGWGPVSFFIRTRQSSEFLVGTVALLSLTQIAFLVLGIVAMARQARPQALRLGILVLAGFVLYAVNGSNLTLLMMLPIVVLFDAAGLRYLYKEWRTVFPKNPLPKTAAVLLLGLVCIQQFVFCVHYVHRVWPHTEQTKALYVLK